VDDADADADAIIALICDVATRFAELAQDCPIRPTARLQIGQVLGAHLSRMR